MKSDKAQLYLIFSALIELLKDQGIHLSVAARAIGQNVKTVGNWVNRKSGPKQEHIDALLLAFPTQLTAKAKEMGLTIPVAQMKISENERALQLLEASQLKLKQMEQEMEEMKEQSGELSRLKKENALLLQQIDRLTKMLESKLK